VCPGGLLGTRLVEHRAHLRAQRGGVAIVSRIMPTNRTPSQVPSPDKGLTGQVERTAMPATAAQLLVRHPIRRYAFGRGTTGDRPVGAA
jgi:hypothetical protein